MNIYDFMDPEDWDDLPEGKSEAFAVVVRRSQSKLNRRVDGIRDNYPEDDAAPLILEANFDFMTSMLGVASNWEVPFFAEYETPESGDFDRNWHRRFQSDINHFLAQMAAGSAMRRRETSVKLDNKTKSSIRAYVHNLKTAVDESSLSDARKSALLRKLSDFERELDGPRTNIILISLLAIEILGHPGAVWQSYETVQRLVTSVMHSIGEGKAAEDEARAASLPPPRLQISYAPRSAVVKTKRSPPQPYDLNDDIPF